MTTKDAGKKNTGKQGGISEQIMDWVKGNDWYRIDIQTNQLRLEQAFGQAIETIAKDLDYQNQPLMSRKIYDFYDLMLAKCGKIDTVCRNGCRSIKELQELELLRGRVGGLAFELSNALESLQRTSEYWNSGDSEKQTSMEPRCETKSTAKQKRLKPRLSIRLSEKEQQVWAAIHIQSKNIAQAAFEFKCTTQNVYKHLKNAERKMKVQGSRSANTRHNRLPEDGRGQVSE